MNLSRRQFSLFAAAFGLAGCGSSQPQSRAARALPPSGMRPVPNAAYTSWVAGFRQRAEAQGFSAGLLNSAFRGTGYLPGVVERDRNQTEFKRSLEDYLSIAVSDERVSKGRAAYARYRSTLQALEQRYGVDSYIIAAIWGLESYYGERRGDIPVISSTSTLAFDGRRGRFFEGQLIAALKILSRGDVTARNLTGSWAGAMGHTQFIPTSYLSFAVDYTGDGRADIWSEDPTDALASTAAYLSRNGWQRGVAWGAEAGPSAEAGATIQPQPGGPRFTTTRNFRAIKRYNNSDAYAIGVGHLSDRIAGKPPLRGSFPPDAYGFTKDDRIALQRGLTSQGFDAGGADGVLGDKTRAAIRAFQRSRGLPVTGEPSRDLLRAL
ncbi:lytic murein transglycosylase [Donghicola sp. XS_ASV15]|uniref:lytic murein transglycosylase n=1 Tax=Donghicola sp. XS_ASV15 TaxID=3241295 RepID=UPI003514C39D